MSRVLSGLSFKVPESTEIKGIQARKVKARALIREDEGETARKSRSQPAAYRLKKVCIVGLKGKPRKYRPSRASKKGKKPHSASTASCPEFPTFSNGGCNLQLSLFTELKHKD